MIDEAEGRSPASIKASEQDTTGVWERGTHLKGQLGNLRGPEVSMYRGRKDTGRTKFKAQVMCPFAPASETKGQAWYRSASGK